MSRTEKVFGVIIIACLLTQIFLLGTLIEVPWQVNEKCVALSTL